MGTSPNPFEYDFEDLEWFERFSVEPVAPAELRERLAAGEVLETTDIPDYLVKSLVVDAETGLALYRLTQLFGTPNVPGLEAGADQPDRGRTTWQYLFSVTYDPPEGEPFEFYLSVYDYKTEVSAGISGFLEAETELPRSVLEPGREPIASATLPDDEFLVGVVQLVLNMVEEPVPATHKDLWV